MNKTEILMLECFQVLVGGGCDDLHRQKLCLKIEEALNPTKETIPYKKALEIGSPSQKKRKVVGKK